MRLAELIIAASGNSPLVEVQPTGPLSPEQLRARNDRDAKKKRKAAEVIQTASIKAASIRADVGS